MKSANSVHVGSSEQDKMKKPTNKRTEIETIVKQVVDAYRPEKIILFGSYAYGQPNADSDLDLLIIKENTGALY